ncbi:MAG: hypothetical protein U0174_27490 [Polyangiaceae bacterium]
MLSSQPRYLPAVLACLALSCSSGTTTGSSSGGSAEGGVAEDGGSSSVDGGSSSGATPLTEREKGLVGKWIRHVAVDGVRDAVIYKADRTGCYFRRYDTGEKTQLVTLEGWHLEDVEEVTKDQSNVKGYPLLDARGSRSDLYNPGAREIYPSGYVNLYLTPTELDLTCTK